MDLSFLDIFRRTPKPQPEKTTGRRAYDSASSGYRTDGWVTPSTDANAEVEAGLVTTRNRSRDAYRNQPIYSGAVDKMTDKVVGTGIRPNPATGDKGLDRNAVKLWDKWSRVCCPGSRSTVYAMEALLCRSLVVSGEVFARPRWRSRDSMPGLPPVQIQVLESDMLDDTMTESKPNGSVIIQGVEFNAAGQRRFYYFYKQHPGAMLIGTGLYGERAKVASRDVLHLMKEDRPGQVRGTPIMQNVISGLYDLSGYMDAERYRAKGVASIMAFVEDGNPDYGDPVGVDGVAPASDSSGDLVEDANGNPIEQLRPGWIAYLPDGKTIKLNSSAVPSGVSDYISAHMHELAAGTPLSHASFSGDLQGTSFASIKFGLTEQLTAIRSFREQVFIPLALDPIWAWFVDAAIANGLLPDNPALYMPEWSQPMVESADRLSDAKAARMEMRNTTHSRRGIIAGNGKDPDAVDADIRLDMVNRQESGKDPLIVSDGDPSQVSTSGLFQPGLEDDSSSE